MFSPHISFFGWPARKPPTKDINNIGPPSLITKLLPVEIILVVQDHLDLWDIFHLSQTCQALRTISRRNWNDELRRLSREERLEFWTGLAHSILDSWVCEHCCRIHPINSSRRVGILRMSSRTESCSRYSDHSTIGKEYLFQHRHLQLILKHAAQSDEEYRQKRVALLLEPWDMNISTTLDDLATTKEFTAHPRVIDGKLIISFLYRYSRPWSKEPFEPDTLVYGISLCPHSGLLNADRTGIYRRARNLIRPMALYNMVEAAFKRTGVEILGHCARCATDLSVKVEPTGHTVTLRCWRDLGSYASPLALSWVTQAMERGNDWRKGPTLGHEPGSIRKLCKNNGQAEDCEGGPTEVVCWSREGMF